MFCGVVVSIVYFPKQWYTEGFWRLGKDIHECTGSSVAPVARQLLCAGCGLGDSRYAPVQTKWSLAPLSTEKHNGFSTNCLSGQKALQMAPGVLQVAQVALQRSPRGFLFQDSSSRNPLGFLLEDSSLRIPSGFLLQDESSRLPPPGFLFQNSLSRIPLLGFFPWAHLSGFLQDSFSRIPPLGFILQGSSFKIPPLGFLLWGSLLRIPLSGFLQDSPSRMSPLGFFLQDSYSNIPSPGCLL